MDTEAIDLNTMLPNTPVLSSEDCEMIEGPLAYAEAVAVLCTVKIYSIRNVFWAEFYKFFTVVVILIHSWYVPLIVDFIRIL